LTHLHIILLDFEKHITCFNAHLNVDLEWFIKSMQKNLVRNSQKGAPQHLLKKGVQRRQHSLPPLISNPVLNYTQQEELTSFHNTIEMIKVLCNIIKHIFLLFRHVAQQAYTMHWANNETAIIEIFPNAHQKNSGCIVYRLKQQH